MDGTNVAIDGGLDVSGKTVIDLPVLTNEPAFEIKANNTSLMRIINDGTRRETSILGGQSDAASLNVENRLDIFSNSSTLRITDNGFDGGIGTNNLPKHVIAWSGLDIYNGLSVLGDKFYLSAKTILDVAENTTAVIEEVDNPVVVLKTSGDRILSDGENGQIIYVVNSSGSSIIITNANNYQINDGNVATFMFVEDKWYPMQ